MVERELFLECNLHPNWRRNQCNICHVNMNRAQLTALFYFGGYLLPNLVVHILAPVFRHGFIVQTSFSFNDFHKIDVEFLIVAHLIHCFGLVSHNSYTALNQYCYLMTRKSEKHLDYLIAKYTKIVSSTDRSQFTALNY